MRQGRVMGTQPFEIASDEGSKRAAHADAEIDERDVEMGAMQKNAVQKPKSTDSELVRQAKAGRGSENNSVRDTFLRNSGAIKLLSDSNTVSLDEAAVKLAGIAKLKIHPSMCVIQYTGNTKGIRKGG